MDIKNIANALFIFISTGLITFIGALIWKFIKDTMEAARCRGLLLLDIEEANKRHYEEDRVFFQRIEKQIGEGMVANARRFEALEIRMNGQYSNEIIEEKLKQRDLQIDNLGEKIDDLKVTIHSKLDELPNQLADKLEHRLKGQR